MPSWDPQMYLKFGNQRTRPARDLAAAVELTAPHTILDAGCGPGNSTKVLAERWPGVKLTGLDSSDAMLEAAGKALPDAVFIRRDLREDFSDLGSFDVVFSNAVLQWLPDMEGAAVSLFSLVSPGGVLAVQVPACAPMKTGEGRLETGDAHRLLYATAEEAEFAPFTAGITRFSDMNINHLYERLTPLAGQVTMWETRYCHVLDGYEGLADWYRGTGMRPYLDALPDDELRARFEKRFLQRAAEEFPLASDGRLLFWFKRWFFVAYRAGVR